MKNFDNKTKEKPYICYKNNILYDLNNEFIELTGYRYNRLIGKTLDQLSEILRSNVEISSWNKDTSDRKYIFTSRDEPIHIKFVWEDLDNENKKLYFIKTDSNAFLQGVLATCTDMNKDDKLSEAILSFPDLIHLKADKHYINNRKLFDIKTPNVIGSILLTPAYIYNFIRKNGYYFESERKMLNSSGSYEYYTIKVSLIYEKDQPRYLKLTYIDDTEKVLARKTIEKQNKEMNIILDNIPDSISKLNGKGEYTYMNKAHLEKISPYISSDKNLTSREVFKDFKYKNPEIKGLSFDKTIESRVLRGEKFYNYNLKPSNKLYNDYHNCSAIPIYDDQGDVESAIVIYRDMNYIYKIEEYNALAENIKHLKIRYALISSNDFKIKYVNDEVFLAAKLNFPDINSLSQIIGQDFFDFYNIDEKKEIINGIKLCIKEKRSKYVCRHKFIELGEKKYNKVIFQPIYDENGYVENINCIGMNITEEELENKKITKALKVQEEVFINTSHELKTPINLIFSASQLLDMYIKNEDLEANRRRIENSNKIIRQNCYRSIKLINNILDVSRIEEGFYKLDLENRNIVSIIDDIVSTVSDYTKDNNLRIIFDPEVEDKIIAIDLYKFERIMLNLISNAIKFSRCDEYIFIDLAVKGDFVEISVIDNGIGIDEENIDTIFDKFKQENKSSGRNAEGTGIGLSLVKSLVEIHGGTITLESTVNVGSKFIINLPCKTIDKPVIPLSKPEDYQKRVEMIQFELSDIYS